ncbi:hypothetical protein [Adhaeribacter aquaticus]|uniref:hypothetical protein n=1 Tax=Adhaeribacter aquaticus TaxID=299567 RepID=UPI00146F9FA0|nr:hypothetical protein [Adhaeribacter aquaticus]
MTKKSVTFWILLVASLFIATLLISITLKIMKAAFYLLLLTVVTPIIYFLLKSLLSSGKQNSNSDKLKSRD